MAKHHNKKHNNNIKKKVLVASKKTGKGAKKKKAWNPNSKDGRTLVKLIKQGTITPGMSPKKVRDDYPQFQDYAATSFRSALRRIRMTEGQFVRGTTGKSNVWLVVVLSPAPWVATSLSLTHNHNNRCLPMIYVQRRTRRTKMTKKMTMTLNSCLILLPMKELCLPTRDPPRALRLA
jgi:hypothetical protein